MIKICFICLGNICRSPMAEYIFKDKIKKLKIEDKFYVTSLGTSNEEYGNDIYPPVKELLKRHNIEFDTHYARKFKKEDYEKFDYIICMEKSNIRNLKYIVDDHNNKIKTLLDKDILDPWYTRDFETAYKEIENGINKLLEKLHN